MNEATYDHHVAAIVSLCAGMSAKQIDDLIFDLGDLRTAAEEAEEI